MTAAIVAKARAAGGACALDRSFDAASLARLGAWRYHELGFQRLPALRPLYRALADGLPLAVCRAIRCAGFRQIDAVLDAGGFQFGDSWPADNAGRALAECRRLRAAGKRIVFLPQAFGPFTGDERRRTMRELAAEAQWVFARDAASLAHLESCGVDPRNVRVFPDFTVLVAGVTKPEFRRFHGRPCVVPSARMLDRLSGGAPERYLDMIAGCVRFLRKKGEEPFALLHSIAEDGPVVALLDGRLDRPLETAAHADPRVVKGILSRCSFAVSSRYHAALNCLYQAVPCAITGWSHKYRALVDEFGIPELSFEPGEDASKLLDIAGRLCDPEVRRAYAPRLGRHAALCAAQAEAMWALVL